MMRYIALALACAAGLASWQAVADEGDIAAEKLVAYFFPKDGGCTVLVDFQRVREDLEALPSDRRRRTMVQAMVGIFSGQWEAKCPGATDVRMLAVYIPGTDNYGRPDFGRRIRLLKLEGSAGTLLGFAGNAVSKAEPPDGLAIETY